MKDNNPPKGKYVLRSTYQRLVEENKKLLEDMKILTGDLCNRRMELYWQYRDMFRKQKDFSQALRDVLKKEINNLKNYKN